MGTTKRTRKLDPKSGFLNLKSHLPTKLNSPIICWQHLFLRHTFATGPLLWCSTLLHGTLLCPSQQSLARLRALVFSKPFLNLGWGWLGLGRSASKVNVRLGLGLGLAGLGWLAGDVD